MRSRMFPIGSLMKTFSMQMKLGLSVIPTVIAVSMVSTFIYRSADKKDDDLERAVQMTRLVASQELSMVKMSEALRGYLLNPENKAEGERKKAADEAFSEAAKKLDSITGDVPEINELIRKMAKFDETTLDERENTVLKMIEAHYPKAAQYYLKEYTPARKQQADNFDILREKVDRHAKETVERIDIQRRRTALSILSFLWIGVAFGTLVNLLVSRNLVSAAYRAFDQIFLLSDRLSNSSRELAQQSSGLSEAASEEASAIQETASSVDEVSSMIRKNTENASASLQASVGSREVANQGREVVGRMVNAIEEIQSSNGEILKQVETGNKQMNEIAGVIGEISAKTRVINDIVFQTKLLSFNASVEAARAGEHGKGFAVVAEEVGNLAQMSGNAAKEISEMLEKSVSRVQQIVADTQKRVEGVITKGRATMATGIETAKACGGTLEKITVSIEQVDSRIKEIASASNEQAQGVAEIAKAMNQLDQVTHRNTSIARESATASEQLNLQSAELRRLVNGLISLLKGSSQAAGAGLGGAPRESDTGSQSRSSQTSLSRAA